MLVAKASGDSGGAQGGADLHRISGRLLTRLTGFLKIPDQKEKVGLGRAMGIE